MAFYSKLKSMKIWKRVFIERLTEPIHVNILSLFVYFLGSYKNKINYDLIVRQPNAFGILRAAEYAKKWGIKTISIIEFGVGEGAGLINMYKIAKNITKETGISFKIYGFDTGEGMPQAKDYRDHPDLYQAGDFRMNLEFLRKNLPDNVKLVLGNISETVTEFSMNLPQGEPIGFVSIDVDYYHSTKKALEILINDNPLKYLPITILYFDDIMLDEHNNYCGELLALNEFNLENVYRKIEHHRFLENSRVFRKADWIKQIYYLHVLDHPKRFNIIESDQKKVLGNPYIGW